MLSETIPGTLEPMITQTSRSISPMPHRNTQPRSIMSYHTQLINHQRVMIHLKIAQLLKKLNGQTKRQLLPPLDFLHQNHGANLMLQNQHLLIQLMILQRELLLRLLLKELPQFQLIQLLLQLMPHQLLQLLLIKHKLLLNNKLKLKLILKSQLKLLTRPQLQILQKLRLKLQKQRKLSLRKLKAKRNLLLKNQVLQRKMLPQS